MLKIWINKCVEENASEGFESALHFNILEENRDSNVKSDIEKLWRSLGVKIIDSPYEDFMIISMAIFAVDKKISRSDQKNERADLIFEDAWTRKLHLNIPVLNYVQWKENEKNLEEVLSFLTGDVWKIEFRRTKYKYRQRKDIRKKSLGNVEKIRAVSLFSGGLDSYCGALKLMSEEKNTCFVGFKEYNLLKRRQTELYDNINEYHSERTNLLKLFNVRPYSPLNAEGEKISVKGENSSRSRSILFIAGAMIVSSLCSETKNIYIPENGFIGINVPISDSRQGSCSTRTTHPFFINGLNDIFSKVGIDKTIVNFYSDMTKGELVQEFSKHELFLKDSGRTISCSHPMQSRYDQVPSPKNCGYCYPCIIRKASMNKVNFTNEEYNPNYDLSTSFLNMYTNFDSKSSDFRAILYAIRNYIEIKDNDLEIESMILKHGKLSYEDVKIYKQVYIKSMEELYALIENSVNKENLFEYIGLDDKE